MKKEYQVVKLSPTVTMFKSTSVYNPHWTIEVNGETIVNVYEDAFPSPRIAEQWATDIYNRLKNSNLF